jgi:hypothetical protein
MYIVKVMVEWPYGWGLEVNSRRLFYVICGNLSGATVRNNRKVYLIVNE